MSLLDTANNGLLPVNLSDASKVEIRNKWLAKLPLVSDTKIKNSKQRYKRPVEPYVVLESRMKQDVSMLTPNGEAINPVSTHEMKIGRKFSVYRTSDMSKYIVLEVNENAK